MHCERHPFSVANDVCNGCGGAFCADCLVYVQGPAKAPLCLACALVAGGVRTHVRPMANRREVKRRRKELRAYHVERAQKTAEHDQLSEAIPRFDDAEAAALLGGAVAVDQAEEDDVLPPPDHGYAPDAIAGSTVPGNAFGYGYESEHRSQPDYAEAGYGYTPEPAPNYRGELARRYTQHDYRAARDHAYGEQVHGYEIRAGYDASGTYDTAYDDGASDGDHASLGYPRAYDTAEGYGFDTAEAYETAGGYDDEVVAGDDESELDEGFIGDSRLLRPSFATPAPWDPPRPSTGRPLPPPPPPPRLW